MLQFKPVEIIKSPLFTSFLNINSLSKIEQKINMHEQERLKKQQKQAKNDRKKYPDRNTLPTEICVCAALDAEVGIKHWCLIQCSDFTTHHTHRPDAARPQV